MYTCVCGYACTSNVEDWELVDQIHELDAKGRMVSA